MEKYFFMRPLLGLLAQPGFIHRTLAMILRVFAILLAVGSLVLFLRAGKVVIALPAAEMLGGILFEILFVFAIYAVVHTMFIRAQDIDEAPRLDFGSFGIAAILARLFGEIYAAFVAIVSLGGALYVWFTRDDIRSVLQPVPPFFPLFGDRSFLGGFQLLIGGVMSAVLALVVAYVVADVFRLMLRHAQRP